jgi:tetratricopeptide (TPR) repeat protein
MNRSSWFLTAALLGTNVALVQPAIAAKSAAEVQAIARAVTVEIRLQQDSSVGSGIIVAHQGDLYTIATNRHVVCGRGSRSKVPAGETYELGLADGQKYRVKAASVKLIGTDLDLAIIQFRSSRTYSVAQIGSAGGLKVEDVVYTAGFPLSQPGFSFNQGNVIAVVDKRITGDRGGHSTIYDAFTAPGMSGGGVFDGHGRLVAIHGQGDRFRENTELDNNSSVNTKMGYNRGISVRWLVKSLADLEIRLDDVKFVAEQMSLSADEYFIAGFNRFIEPGDDVVAGKRIAIQEFNNAIQINPRYAIAYFIKAYTHEQLQEFQQSLRDYDRAISLNPKLFSAYSNRGLLKADKLNDVRGALSDYNRAISFKPNFSDFYYNRAGLKADKLNDVRGALSDYNRAISLNPKHASFYYNRAILKQNRLNDVQGALSDYNRAISLNPKHVKAHTNRAILKQNQLNDVPGALSDYDLAIALNPKHANAYYNRGFLKEDKLNNVQGALSDYNRAISLDPKYADAYNNRGLLKSAKLNDKAGAIQDIRQAAKLFRARGQTQYLQKVLDFLRQLGATERSIGRNLPLQT